jgi:transposase
MAETATEVSTTDLVDAKRRTRRPKRRQWSEASKRRIVAETLEPDASVSIVARRHDVNANQLFKWRREMAPPVAAAQSVTMLPVAIVPEPGTPRGRARRSGTIEITLAGGARVCIRGEVSPEALQQVIELLR